jgi:hypothetical protein
MTTAGTQVVAVPAPMDEAQAPAALAPALSVLRGDLAAGRVVPYLGPGLLALGDAPLPLTPQSLALALHAKAPVSGRLRGLLWATAQFIESRRHRKTLTALMAEVFRTPAVPTALHRKLAGLGVPLIVDTWYDGAMRTALVESGRGDWGEVQGITRAGQYRDIWTKAYDASGSEVDPARAGDWTTVLYKPHGAVTPAANFLVSDSDYVEVLTEIDIQSPIPDVVKERRRGRSFVFLGTRFDDQMLRIFARQITKRAGDHHVAVLERATLTRNEGRFLDEAGIGVLDCSLDVAVAALAAD